VVDKSRRILTATYCAGGLEPGYNPVAYEGIENTPEQQAILARASRATLVLAKNEGSVLPIDQGAITSLAVIGPYAAEPRFGAIGSGLTTGPTVAPLRGIEDKLAGTGVTVVTDNWQSADYVVVFVGINDEGEGFDRENLDLPTEISDTLTVDQNALVGEVLAAKPDRTIVVYTGGSFSVAGTWSSAPAVLIALYPGGDQGNAIADALFGDYNPGGKLSITFPQTADQVPPWGTDASLYSTYEDPDEGRGWPYYERHDLEPLFPFGHGLSYTTFVHSNLRITPTTMAQDGTVTVEVDVRNSGDVAGDEVVQLYIGDPEASVPRRVKDLRGFVRMHLEPNEKHTAVFTLDAEDLAFFDDTTNQWVAEAGTFEVLIGSSSRDIRLGGTFELLP
jgi:beta-glucosidase